MKKKTETKQAEPVPEPSPKQAKPLLTVGETFNVAFRGMNHPARVVAVNIQEGICVLRLDDHREVSFSIESAVKARL